MNEHFTVWLLESVQTVGLSLDGVIFQSGARGEPGEYKVVDKLPGFYHLEGPVFFSSILVVKNMGVRSFQGDFFMSLNLFVLMLLKNVNS